MVVTAADFIYSLLSADADVIALVDGRIAPAGDEQDASDQVFPYIAYKKQSGRDVSSHSGFSGVSYPLYSIECTSRNYSELDNLGEAVKRALRDYQGTAGGLTVQRCRFVADGDDYNANKKAYVRWINFVIWHDEAE